MRSTALGAALLLAILGSLFVGREAPAATAPTSDSEAHIRRVEHGLLPALLVHGEKLPVMSLRDEMKRRKVPGVSIAVIDRGTVVWARGYGLSEAGTTDSLTTETLFQAGSVSKPVAAMTALRLVQAGRVKLDDDVNQALRSWKIPPSDSAKDIAVTLRMLLTHSAGLTVHGFRGYASGDSIPSLVQVLDGVRPANSAPVRVDIRPGSRFRYSGGGYCIAQQLLMDLTGESYTQLAEKAVLGPLSMTHSTFEQPVEPVPGVRRATGHGPDGVAIAGKWHRHPELAAAGLWTTPSDLARLVLEVRESFHGASGRVLSPAMTRAMLTPQITATQGIGWRLAGRAASARFAHSGDTDGYVCAVVGYLTGEQGAVVMTNGVGGGDLVNEILCGIAHEYGWPNYLPAEKRVVAVPVAQLSRLAGRYAVDIAPGVFVDFAASRDSLFVTVVQPSGTQRGLVLAESPTRFFDRESGLEFKFVAATKDRPRYLVVRQGSDEYHATLVP
jgi:CubicO group peptidase (beta-lactamase class C family)